MAFTQSDIDALDAAIARATLRVRFSDGREVTYRSMDELLKARTFMASQLTLATAGAPCRDIYTSFVRD